MIRATAPFTKHRVRRSSGIVLATACGIYTVASHVRELPGAVGALPVSAKSQVVGAADTFSSMP